MDVLQTLKTKRPLTVAGLMTGTSMDGLDICVVEIDFYDDSARFSILGSGTFQFPPELRKTVQSTLSGTAEQVCRTHYDLGRFYAEQTAEFLARSAIGPIDAVGLHGQTVYHISGKATLQIGEPSFIAERLAIPVVSDFRARDISVGGTGAPLIPFVDRWIFQKEGETVVCLNLGGMANVSVIPPSSSGNDVTGFDTGPGMALLDDAVANLAGQRQDSGGEIASTGKVHETLLNEWMKDEFVTQAPPKSTGREYFAYHWLQARIGELAQWRLEDLLATLSLFTARSVVVNCRRFVDLHGVKNVIVSGGGVHHGCVMKMLSEEFSPIKVISSDAVGIDPDMKEALGMAVLAALYFKEIPGNIPSVTGASRPVILGKLTI